MNSQQRRKEYHPWLLLLLLLLIIDIELQNCINGTMRRMATDVDDGHDGTMRRIRKITTDVDCCYA